MIVKKRRRSTKINNFIIINDAVNRFKQNLKKQEAQKKKSEESKISRSSTITSQSTVTENLNEKNNSDPTQNKIIKKRTSSKNLKLNLSIGSVDGPETIIEQSNEGWSQINPQSKHETPIKSV